jgi:hypothetical protein
VTQSRVVVIGQNELVAISRAPTQKSATEFKDWRYRKVSVVMWIGEWDEE